MEVRNEGERYLDESKAKEEKAIRAFFEFLNRHPDRMDQFIRSVIDARVPRKEVERALDNEDQFVAVVLGNREKDAEVRIAASAAGPDRAGM